MPSRKCTFANRCVTTLSILWHCLIFIGKVNAQSVFTCCHLQNAFKGGSCDVCIPATKESPSEFDTPQSFPAKWSVPEKLRYNQLPFDLSLETRNSSTGYCKARFRIYGKYDATNTAGNSVSDSVYNENEVSEWSNNTIIPTFLANGSMIFKNISYYPYEYCIDRLPVDGESTVFDISVIDRCNCQQAQEISSSTRQPYPETWINQLFAAVSGLSCLFTILNVIIYLSLRNYLNVSGWVEFTYFLALGLFSASSIPAFLHNSPSHDDSFCYVISVILQFSEILVSSSYFIIAFDVYWILRKADTFASYGEEIEESKMRLVFYLLLFFAVPIGITTYGIILDQEHVAGECYSSTVPTYGRKSCFAPAWLVSEYLIFGIESSTLIIILFSVNHIFGRLSASTDVDDAPRVSLLSNMFFFTLSYWIMDLLKFARPLLVGNASQVEINTEAFWILLDGSSYAQGLLSFIVFIFNRKTLRAFRKKAGTDGNLRAIFRHACCSDAGRVDAPEGDSAPMSPLMKSMKSSSMRRTTVRQNNLY